MYNNICRKKNSYSITNKKKERERGEHKQSNFKNINSKTPEKLSLATNYHILSLLPIMVRLSHKFKVEKQKLVLNFESCYYFR